MRGAYYRLDDRYDAYESLAAAHGSGSVKGRPPESTHCTNIGPVHRKSLHPLLKRWFDIDVSPDQEYSAPRPKEELQCLTPESARGLDAQPVCRLLTSSHARRRSARADWARVLGDTEPKGEPVVEVVKKGAQGSVVVERLALRPEPGIVVPVLLLRPVGEKRGRMPCVVAVGEGGKAAFLRHRAEGIAGLLRGGVAVCLPDVRGVGETRPEGSRERWGAITDHAAAE